MNKIAYIPTSNYSNNLGYDLRNIILYAKLKKIKIDKFNELKSYDYIVLPPTFDISNINWLKKRKEKIIFQLVDDYLSEKNLSIKNIFRGTYKYLKNENKKISFNYKKNLEEICKISHAVICSSKEQKNKITKLNKNVHVFFEGNFKNINSFKDSFKTSKIFKIVWEGRCENIPTLKIFYPAFEKLIKKNKIELHIISDFEIKNRFNLNNFNSLKEIKKIFNNSFSSNTTFKKSNVYLHQWNLSFNNIIIKNSDLAIIPLRKKHNFENGKSNNKLSMFMRNRIPVLTSKIDSYEEIFKKIKIHGTCSSTNEWINKVEKLVSSEKLRKKFASRGYNYIKSKFGEKQFLKQWEKIFK